MPGESTTIDGFRKGYEEEHRLIGRRSACGFVTATWGLVCPRCGKRDLAEVELSGRGRIAAITVQTVPGDEFVNDAPYAYVLVDLAEGGRISGWIAGTAPGEGPAIGDLVQFVPSYRPGVQFRRGDDRDAGR
ncbi:MAG TPA: OB-fold domain-containing protein [Thermoplasmata archaeon]|nr:OB-fold domain-containing protein [Thermoplasmata archaeon]